ncbi:aldo/keto reductase [Sulfitobacter pacificus]|uniref:aldo/keto reductase n=1 Tax=Sulfitobacter pacificus TaxID=1499314 RepID=UPI00310C5EB1
MQKRTLSNSLDISAIGLGCMGMSEFYGPRNDEDSRKVLHRAVDLGVTFFDTADMYGSGHNEELLGKFLDKNAPDIVLATKFGIRRNPGQYARSLDNSPAYARASCEASLKRLGREHIDLFYVHRLDQSQPVEEVMGELSLLVGEGKIGHIGLCEVSTDTLRRAHAIHPVTALQTEYSLWSRDVEETILPTCTELGIGFVPYSPLGRGFLTGTFDKSTQFAEGDFRAGLPRFAPDNIEQNTGMVQVLQKLAQEKNCTPAQLALAWVLSKGDNVVPIPGTRRIKYLEENVAASDLVLTSAEIQQLEGDLSNVEIKGQRYTEEGMKGVNA